MSDYFYGYRYQQQPSLRRSRNILPDMPYTFPSYFYYPDHFRVYGSSSVHNHLIHHHDQPNTNYTTFSRLPPTANLRGGEKAYFRFHGGIGGGCYRPNIRQITAAARPLQLFNFNAPGRTDFQMPMTRPPVLPVEGNSGTGVFLPMYDQRSQRILAGKGMHVRGGQDDNRRRHRVQTKQEDAASSSRAFVGGGDVEKKEPEDIKEEIPIELLLPSEWTY